MILPGTQSTSRAILMGWDAWLVASKANTTGLTLGNGHLRILNTNIMVSDSPNCTEYAAAARELVNVHKVCLQGLQGF